MRSTPILRHSAYLVPQSLVPVSAFSISKVILLKVHGGVEDKLGGIAAILGPVYLVAGPLGVGVSGEDKREEVLLHLALYDENQMLARTCNSEMTVIIRTATVELTEEALLIATPAPEEAELELLDERE